MKNAEIYEKALSLIAEPHDSLRLEDYAERSPHVLSCFISDNLKLDEEYRKLTDKSLRGNVTLLNVTLDDDFPLSERFSSAAAAYLASVLVCDSDSELFEKLFEMYAQSMQKISDEIFRSRQWTACGESVGTVDVYGSIT